MLRGLDDEEVRKVGNGGDELMLLGLLLDFSNLLRDVLEVVLVVLVLDL